MGRCLYRLKRRGAGATAWRGRDRRKDRCRGRRSGRLAGDGSSAAGWADGGPPGRGSRASAAAATGHADRCQASSAGGGSVGPRGRRCRAAHSSSTCGPCAGKTLPRPGQARTRRAQAELQPKPFGSWSQTAEGPKRSASLLERGVPRLRAFLAAVVFGDEERSLTGRPPLTNPLTGCSPHSSGTGERN